MYKKRIYILLTIFLTISIFHTSSSYALSKYIWSDSNKALETTANNESSDLKLKSDGAILIEQTTGQVLYEHNSHEMFRPASVTKVMSLLLIMEALDSRSDFLKRYCPMF